MMSDQPHRNRPADRDAEDARFDAALQDVLREGTSVDTAFLSREVRSKIALDDLTDGVDVAEVLSEPLPWALVFAAALGGAGALGYVLSMHLFGYELLTFLDVGALVSFLGGF